MKDFTFQKRILYLHKKGAKPKEIKTLFKLIATKRAIN